MECSKEELKAAGCPEHLLDAVHAEALRLGFGHGELIGWIAANSGSIWALFQQFSKFFPAQPGPVAPPVNPTPAHTTLMAHGCPPECLDAVYKMSIDAPGLFAWLTQWGPEFWAAFQSLSALLNKTPIPLG